MTDWNKIMRSFSRMFTGWRLIWLRRTTAQNARNKLERTASTTPRGASRASSNSELALAPHSLQSRYQGPEASLASQKSAYEGSRVNNLALINQLYGSREDLKKQIAECKTGSQHTHRGVNSSAVSGFGGQDVGCEEGVGCAERVSRLWVYHLSCH